MSFLDYVKALCSRKTDLTISLDSGLVEIKVNGNSNWLWSFNESNHPRFEVNQ